ncbi:hypothetical protein [Cognatitamlana onchidii]|uniref:hypothetical protein n=1 Tax=Cognatitamlana onchidii TaxID=2562860 RepID=UPI0010A5BF02|nr:hypothetical protein [Algibacter onchidii]
MRFEDSHYSNINNYHCLEMAFGKFYLCEKFIVSEINSGIHFDWNKIESVIEKIIAFYGTDIKLGYISNRINSYSIDPQDWAKVAQYGNILAGSAIVYYNYIMYLNAALEKRFSKSEIHPCLSLDDAISYINDLKEFN